MVWMQIKLFEKVISRRQKSPLALEIKEWRVFCVFFVLFYGFLLLFLCVYFFFRLNRVNIVKAVAGQLVH